MNGAQLSVEDLEAGYQDNPVIHGISCGISHNEAVAVVGPNGSGKSTLLRAITGVIRSSSGRILFEGQEIRGLPTERVICLGIGYLKQTKNIFPSLSVEENLLLSHRKVGGDFPTRRDLVLRSLGSLSGKLDTRAGLLSGGERQALAVSMILMRRVRLLLMDEPVAGLSQAAAERLLEGIGAMKERESFTLIMVEHRLRIIQPWVERAVVMTGGTIVEDTPDTSILTDRSRLERHYHL